VPCLEYVLSPLRLPTLPVVAAIGILVGLVPAWAAPVERTSLVVRSGPTSRPSAAAESEDLVTGPVSDTLSGAAPADAVAPVGLPGGNGG
jgi:hypothetical protein